MALAIIVTSYESPETLRRCLASLLAQGEAGEIVVSDCSRTDPSLLLGPLFPCVRFLHFSSAHTVPQLRWLALQYVSADLVAAVEARCVPSETWCRDFIAAHAAAPESPALGGPVLIEPGASLFDWGLYFCEYAKFAPPLQFGPAIALSGANLCYRRSALQQSSDLTERGEWETLLHQRWVSEGKQLVLCTATVTFFNSMSVSAAMQQRCHYGRGYAADRLRGATTSVRAGYALAACVLPVLLTWRMGKRARKSKLLPLFLQSVGWIILLTFCWSTGEFAGYLAGHQRKPRIF